MPAEGEQKATASQKDSAKNNPNSVPEDKRKDQCLATTVP